MTIKVGVSGGIGSGKSTICTIFKLLGAPVFEADKTAKYIIDHNIKVRSALIRLFGEDIYLPGNGIDRKKLAEIIFSDDIQRQKVNQIVHPEVRADFECWCERQHAPYIIHEAAILFESGFYRMMDFTILITAPQEVRLKRVVVRDETVPEKVLARMQMQWTDEQKRKLATFEIVNDNRELIIPKIIQIDKNLRTHGKIW